MSEAASGTVRDAPPVAAAAPPAPLKDVVSRAAERGREQGNTANRVTKDDLAEARLVFGKIRVLADLESAVPQLCDFVERFPHDERFQALVARALERFQESGALEIWRGMDARFPASRQAYLRYLRWVIRLRGETAGRDLHETRFPETPETARRMFIYAAGLLEMKAFEAAEEVLKDVLTLGDVNETTFVDLIRTYLGLRQPARAREIALEARGRFPASALIIQLVEQIDKELLSLGGIVADRPRGGHAHNIAIERVFKLALDRRRQRQVAMQNPRFVGRVVHINGSLGAGGAERQLVNTLLGLKSLSDQGRGIGGVDILGPLHVVCRSTGSRKGADFYVPTLEKAQFEVLRYSTFEDYGGRPRYSAAAPYSHLVDFLPHQMREGILKLSDALRYISPDIVHIWQDGSALAAGAAALIAGVPRIIIGVRTLPPSDRFERNKPEYETTYRALAAAAGVSIVANSAIAARRYEEWLDMPKGRVRVIPNGLAIVSTEGSNASREKLKAFDLPADAFVVGSVIRFDANKRPLLWLDVACAVLARDAKARFILVGDGPLFHQAEQHARQLRIADKVLFVGKSSEVGFWLAQMHAFLLLSRHEGLPNVVIEAEMAGVPVVSTPAGGTAEALEHELTGTLLDRIDDLDPEACATAVLSWKTPPAEQQPLKDRISAWAYNRFSISRMIERTVATYLDCDLELIDDSFDIAMPL